MLEIGFGHKISKQTLFPIQKLALKIWEKHHMIKYASKSEKTLISCLMGKIPYFRVFPLFGGIILHMILFSNILSKFLDGKQDLVWVFWGQNLFQALYLKNKPLKSTLAA